MIKYDGQMKSATYNIYFKKSHHKNNDGKYNRTIYCDDIMCFDIEVSSCWLDEDNNIIEYKTGMTNDYWNNLQELSLSYIWQFGFNDIIYYGRDLREFVKLLEDMPKHFKKIIYVHNLSYEFQFLLNILKFDDIFAKSPRKVMKCFSEEYNIEFRCSFFLTNLSLDNWGKEIGVNKLIGSLDYEKIRTPLTTLTAEELNYCEHDIMIMLTGLSSYRDEYVHLENIPLTSTGIIRRNVLNIFKKDSQYMQWIKTLLPDWEMYGRLLMSFSGGYTHCNMIHSNNHIFTNEIKVDGFHRDFNSSYPYVMLTERFGMTPFIEIHVDDIKSLDLEKYAYIIEIKFNEIRSNNCFNYIQFSKCYNCKNVKLDNGRVISANSLTITITEQDLITIMNNYNVGGYEIIYIASSVKDYLPKPLLSHILDLYKNKTTLKGVKGEEFLYMKSKKQLNSLYGMMVTNLINPDVIYDQNNNEWYIESINKEKFNELIDNKKNGINRKMFTAYQWGVWVTAYARRNLWKCLEACGKNSIDALYCDTDSIFYLGEIDFTFFDHEVISKINQSAEYNNLNIDDFSPMDINGNKHTIGLFEMEDCFTEFISLGAKKYCYRKHDGELILTVSGVTKKAVSILNDDIRNFKIGLSFDKDYVDMNKKLLKYLKEMPNVCYPDGFFSDYKFGINMRRIGYEISISNEYEQLLDGIVSNFRLTSRIIEKLRNPIFL